MEPEIDKLQEKYASWKIAVATADCRVLKTTNFLYFLAYFLLNIEIILYFIQSYENCVNCALNLKKQEQHCSEPGVWERAVALLKRTT